ncbi:helix-turn-helix domain-containing protein [Cupriavidus sp. CuC1]|uniref:helix-turn-helix domain-containing protein n=1 Tax=Cupriavidus sp. CuC1 TaxID=3373131 RepID=UPI0037CDF7C7
MVKRMVAINDQGLRIGEDHQNAKLTDSDVERIRQLHGEGLSYRTLADKFEVSKSLIALICRWERRAQTAKNWRAVHVPES